MTTNGYEMLQVLDEMQLEAVNALHGPVAILAGAGTGKTRTIAHRIANGVLSGTYSPERVLALSFTRKAAAELQERLVSMGVIGVRSRTFHSAALKQLGFFWEQIMGSEKPKILNSKLRILENILSEKNLRLSPEAMRDLASEIEWRKTSLLTISEYESLLDSRPGIPAIENENLVEIMTAYERVKKTRRLIDFEDVLLIMAGMLEEEPRVAHSVREQYRFFTVDEYQDVSAVQHNLLKAWLGKRTDLCVVGDVSQTIYSFAGASSRFLLDFKREYPEATVFRLEKNYRSSPEIINLANNVMHEKPGALQLKAVREKNNFLPLNELFSNEREEAEGVANKIKMQIDEGAHPSEIAVLYRSHSHSLHIQDALRTRGISIRPLNGESFFDRPEVKRTLIEIRAGALADAGKPAFQTVTDIIRGQGWTSAAPTGGTKEREKWESLNAILRLLDTLDPQISLKSFSEELSRRSKLDQEPTTHAVTLGTVHAAKGLEWPRVWLMGLTEGNFPIGYAKNTSSIEEERRLFYVAVTRARDQIYFSGAASNISKVSRFIRESGVQTKRSTVV